MDRFFPDVFDMLVVLLALAIPFGLLAAGFARFLKSCRAFQYGLYELLVVPFAFVPTYLATADFLSAKPHVPGLITLLVCISQVCGAFYGWAIVVFDRASPGSIKAAMGLFAGALLGIAPSAGILWLNSLRH